MFRRLSRIDPVHGHVAIALYLLCGVILWMLGMVLRSKTLETIAAVVLSPCVLFAIVMVVVVPVVAWRGRKKNRESAGNNEGGR